MGWFVVSNGEIEGHEGLSQEEVQDLHTTVEVINKIGAMEDEDSE